MATTTEETFSARLDCRYLLRTPDAVDSKTPLVVTLHGFGANPEIMLHLTARLFPTEPVIASVAGPYRFFLSTSDRTVGYGWITSRHPAESIRLHHDMVSRVLEDAGTRFGIAPARRLLVGFSQSGALNYRFAATCPDELRGVVAICGGLPGDWETAAYQPVHASILHIARAADEHYPPAVTEKYPERLRQRAADVDFHLIDGGHQMPSAAADIVTPWLRRIL